MEIINGSETVSLRRMLSELGTLSKSMGSASFSQGETIIISAIHGPSEIKFEKEGNLEANVEVVYKLKSGESGCYEKLIENLIKGTCKSMINVSQYPRSNICVLLNEIQQGGSTISCCANAACLALIDAGVSLKCLTAAVFCIISADGKVTIDPTDAQEKEAKASMFVAFDSQDYKIISSHIKGILTQEKYQECLSLCRNASKSIFQFYKEAVTRKLSKSK